MSEKFFRGRKPKHIKIYRLIAFLILLVFLIFVLNLTGFSGKIKNLFFLISSPLQSGLQKIGKNISDFLFSLWHHKLIKRELDQAYLNNLNLLYQIANLQELKKENETLRQALGLGLEKEYQLVLVRLISFDLNRDIILINKGAQDGFVEGWPVITNEKVLIGRISRVYDQFSEVTLISSKASSFDAKIIDKEIYGLVKGKENFKIYLDLIPKDAEISEGDQVVTAVLGGLYPANLLVGKIKTIKKSDIEAFQQAEIEPFFDVKKLDYLLVIKSF